MYYFIQMSFYYMIKYLAFSCMHKQGLSRFVPLKLPVKVLIIQGLEIKQWYQIMLSKVRLKILGDNNNK